MYSVELEDRTLVWAKKSGLLPNKYDARGNITEYIDGRQTKIVREYTKTDLLKKEMAFVLETENKYCDNPSETRTYDYDEAGFMKTASDSSTSISYNQASGKYESDAYGNIYSMKWSATGLEMKYDYDLLGRTTGVTTPDGKTVNYTYDKNGLLTAMDGFIKGSIKYETDKARIESYTLENGIEKTFNYNSLGNISAIEYSAESKNIKTGFSYIYDNNYNITSRTALDTNKTSWFTYDKADRLTQSQMHGAFETRESLDNGSLSQIDHDLDGAKEAEIFFDALPENITLDTATRAFIYDFGQDVSVNKVELFPDAYTHRVRERDIRIYSKESDGSEWKEIKNWKFTKNEKNGSLCFAFKEAVNACQIKIRCTWDDRNFLNVSIDTKSTFKGNPQNLLRIWKLEESRIEDYEYDGNSNRKSIKENGTERKYKYYKNKENGNTARVMSDGKWYYSYDANGNRTAKGYNKNSGSDIVKIDESREYWTYTWDLWNRLIKVEQHNAPDNAENVCVEYTYDVLNHRIQRVSKTKSTKETTQYAYGRNGAITYQKKTSGDSVTTRRFVYLNNQIVGFTEKEGNTESKYYAVTDIQGSVTEVYDSESKLVWKSGYTAFGIKAGETTSLLDFDGQYTGCDYDSETGLTYHWNRWRSEDGGSWLTQDPVRDGMNWYGYAGQNPVNCFDSTGLETTTSAWQYQKDMEARAKDRGETGSGVTDGTPAPYEESPQITNQAGKRQIASFYEQYGDYNLLPTFRGIETGDSCLNNLLDGFVNYVFVGTYNLGATIVNTFTNGIGGIRELGNRACLEVLGCDLDTVTMTLMANQMLIPAGIMLDGFNSYMNGLKLMNQSRAANAAISTVQTSVNVSAGLVGVQASEIVFSDKFLKGGYKNQVTDRGWTIEKIAETINNPYKISTNNINKYTGNTATYYYIDEIHYVARDDITKKIIQVADLTKDSWK